MKSFIHFPRKEDVNMLVVMDKLVSTKVISLSRAAWAVGVNDLMVEVHNEPQNKRSDGA